MKKVISLFLSMVMLLSVTAGLDFSAFADEYEGFKYTIIDNDTAKITRYNGDASELVVPAQINGYIIKSIDSYAFYANEKLKSVIIENGIEIIDDYAFYSCENLEKINFSNTLVKIGRYAFYDCVSLLNVDLPYGVSSIGESAFARCKNLKNISMPNSVVDIKNAAFASCVNLSDFNLSESLEKIGDSAFVGCLNLQHLYLPSNVMSVGRNPFSGCKGLMDIVVSPNNRYFDSRNNCNAIIQTNTNTLVSGCNNTVIPNDVLVIGSDSLRGLNYEYIEIPESVVKIDNYALIDCENLKEIYIPESVKYIGTWILVNCVNLEKIEVDRNNSVFDSRENCNAIIETSSNKLISGCKATKIPNTVNSIGSGAFYQCKKLTDISIPKSVSVIGSDAFSGCSGLLTVHFPENMKEIGMFAFTNCKNLKEVYFPNSLKVIENSAFWYCDSLSDVYYHGNSDDWNKIVIKGFNDEVREAQMHYIDHTYNDGETTKDSSCIEDGVKTYTCIICGDSYTESIEKLPHTIVIDNAVEPTCIKTGLTQGSHCAVCNEIIIKQNVVPAKGHSEVIDNAAAPTCTQTGLTEGTHCSECNEILLEQKIIEKLPHNGVWQNENGFLVKRCTECAEELSRLHFTDIQYCTEYGDYIEYTSVFNKFITGTNPPANNVFSPTAPINRAMFVTILYRMAGSPYDNGNNPYKSTPFTDITNTSAYYYNAACWALENGITTETVFKPFDNVTREQAASMLFRYATANDWVDEAYKTADITKYPDYSSVHIWAQEPMQWANYNKMITGTQQGYLNPQGATQRVHATKILYGFCTSCGIGNFE